LREDIPAPYHACKVQSSTPFVVDPPAKQEIPDKLYFRIGDVSRLAGVKAYVLRYWESEFPAISPKKSGTGQRLYRRKDVELILEIKHLLYEKRFTIEGARKAIEDRPKPEKSHASRPQKVIPTKQTSLFGVSGADLISIRQELEDILAILK
jgi:DNA-binding transcriptional MerR regulator